jgi:hypothetical protein
MNMTMIDDSSHKRLLQDIQRMWPDVVAHKDAQRAEEPQRASDATTIAGIMPKLSAEQRAWINSLEGATREMTEDILQQKGERYFLENYEYLKSQMERIQTQI